MKSYSQNIEDNLDETVTKGAWAIEEGNPKSIFERITSLDKAVLLEIYSGNTQSDIAKMVNRSAGRINHLVSQARYSL